MVPRQRRKLFTASAILASASALMGLFYHLGAPCFREDPPMPDPNGYEDLVRAGKMVVGEDPPLDSSAGLEELHAWVAENFEALQLAREGLRKDCRVAIRYSAEDIGDQLAFRKLAYLFRDQGKVAENEGNLEVAATRYLDLVRLGVESRRGGLISHEVLGGAIEEIGLSALRSQEENFKSTALKSLISSLDAILSRTEPFERSAAREAVWERRITTWRNWTEIFRDQLASPDVYSEDSREDRLLKMRNMVLFADARLRLLQVELALRAYQLDNSAYPEKLLELVPEYLPRVPQDPFAGGPVIYRRDGTTYLLYSVGPNRKDDGGWRGQRHDLFKSGAKADVFLDS